MATSGGESRRMGGKALREDVHQQHIDVCVHRIVSRHSSWMVSRRSAGVDDGQQAQRTAEHARDASEMVD